MLSLAVDCRQQSITQFDLDMCPLQASLARLQLDYVDVLFCHRPDPDTPIEVRGTFSKNTGYTYTGYTYLI